MKLLDQLSKDTVAAELRSSTTATALIVLSWKMLGKPNQHTRTTRSADAYNFTLVAYSIILSKVVSRYLLYSFKFVYHSVDYIYSLREEVSVAEY